MNTEFWHARWGKDEIYFHQYDINLQLQTFWHRLGLAQAGGCVFVPLCGKSRDMVWLAEQGYTVLGVELSPVAVKSFFEENGLMPSVRQESSWQIWQADPFTLLCGDIFALDRVLVRHVVAVYDRASLIALPPAMRKAYAKHLQNILPAAAPILLVTMEYAQEAMTGPPFSVTEMEVQDLFNNHYNVERLSVQDALAKYSRFRDRGLSYLDEKVYRLHAKTTHADGSPL